jgi:uncharacterized protein (DUF1800 family)
MARDVPATIQLLMSTLEMAGAAPMPGWVDKPIPRKGNADPAQLDELDAWWLGQMKASKTPLAERFVLFWHGFFAASTPNVPAALRARQHRTLRAEAAGNFRSMLLEMVRDPAMLLAHGHGPGSSAVDQVLARALVERFTAAGEGGISNVDRDTIAAALEPRRVDPRGQLLPEPTQPATRTLLGQTGPWRAEDVVKIILQETQTAERVVRRMWRAFVSPTPDPPEVAYLADVLRDGDYELGPVWTALLSCEAMKDPLNRGTLVKSPVELFVGTTRVLYLDVGAKTLRRVCAATGQQLFAPPLQGWSTGRAWLTAQSLDQRRGILGRLLSASEGDVRTPLAGPASCASWLGQPSLRGTRLLYETQRVLLPLPMPKPPTWWTPTDALRQFALDLTYQLA